MAETQVDTTQTPGTATPTPDTSAAPKPDAQVSAPVSGGGTADGGEHMVPSYRLREQREQLESRIAELQSQFDSYREEQESRVRAAFGMGERPDPRKERIKQELLGVIPELDTLMVLASKLGGVEGVEKLINTREAFETSQRESAVNQGHLLFDQIDTLLNEAYGDKVPKLATQSAYSAFQTYLQIEPSAQTKFMRGDQSVVRDFWQAYTSGVLESHRKHFSAQESARRANAARIPRGGPGTDVIGGKREKKTYKDLDDATDAAFDMLREQPSR